MMNNPYASHLSNEDYHGLEAFNENYFAYKARIKIKNNKVLVDIRDLRVFNNIYCHKIGRHIHKIYLKQSGRNLWDFCIESYSEDFNNLSKLCALNGNLRNNLDWINNKTFEQIVSQYMMPHYAKKSVADNNISVDEIDYSFAIFKDLNECAQLTQGFIYEGVIINSSNRLLTKEQFHQQVIYPYSYNDYTFIYKGQDKEESNKIGFVIHTIESSEVLEEVKNMSINLNALGIHHRVELNRRNVFPDHFFGKGSNLDIIVYKMYKSKYNQNEINF